ncbi:MAG TPA: EAL domain-containing protein [Steroidobacteraceae bacterium]
MNVVLPWLRPRYRIRLGIASRLAISFIGVAGLILAANLVVQQGILVERTTRVLAPQPAAPVVTVAAAPAPVHVERAPAAPVVSPLLLEEAVGALARVDLVSQLRIKDASAPADAQYRQALAHLNEAAKSVAGSTASVGTDPALRHVRTELSAYSAHASAMLHTADARRAAEADRTALLDRLDVRVKEPLAGAWTIFGRVVSRQTLVELSDDIDSLRHHAEALEAATPISALQVAAISAAEQRVQKTLSANESAFRRGQSDAWYRAMNADLAQLIARREASIQLASDLADQTEAFAHQSDRLREALLKAGRIMAPALEAVAQVATRPSPAASAAPAVSSPTPALARARAAVQTKSVSRMPADSSSRGIIAWASGAAALLMILMCVGIIISTVVPVKRMVAATSQIAAGQYSVRVASGGITEFDTLANAFNTMADELAAARQASLHYQQGLEEKIQERTRRLQELAQRDPLTGLSNRRHLFALLDAAIERARTSGHWVGVLFLDVDNFKYINDGLGHAFGDSVLAGMGQRLAELSSAYGFAARLGGDEFTVVLERTNTIEEIRNLGAAIVAAFQSAMVIEGRELIVSVSVGACAYPIHAQQAGALLKAADMALFRAKALGRSQLSVFTPDLLDLAAAKFATEQGLRRAIDRNEFELFFQPEISGETLEVGLVEALIRWRAPNGELQLPGAFLPVAEQSGLAIEIGAWVLRRAVSAASSWHRGGWPDARVAINVSPRQLSDGQFVPRVAALLAEFELPARCIEIELTESVLQTGPATVAAIHKMRELGVAVALDDFGTGFSSLASLEILPLSRVKLDRSLICGIDTSPRSAAIAQAIIGMCQKLGLDITAEGVERPEQFAYLARQRSMFIQGFLLAHPVPQHELLPLLPIVRERARELLLTSAQGRGDGADITEARTQQSGRAAGARA